MSTRTLLVDIGNTRVKWTIATDGVLAPQGAAQHSGWSVADWERELFGASSVEAVEAVTVAGESSRQALVAAAARRGVAHVRFHVPRGQACGVTCAYPEPGLLGADRWAAIVGAHALFAGRACCVVDVGTAATVDALGPDGRHLGGYIVPGPRLMVGALHAGTSDLAAHSAASALAAGAGFADNTRDAIERGCRVALGAFVERAHADLAHMVGTVPVLVMTGGAATDVLPYVFTEVESVPDLVLHGVLRLAGAGA